MPDLDPSVVPFASSYNKPDAPDPKPELSAESIRQRLNSVQAYMNKYGPGIAQGMSEANQDQADYLAKVKSNRNQYISPITKIQNEISGNVFTGPNPALKYDNIPTLDYVKGVIEKSKIESSALNDPYATMRPTAFNATSAGFNFDRYYSHDKFDEGLGFSIYRDNERLYNANSTAWDDFGRMSKKWLSLAGQGATSVFKNWGRFGAVGETEDAAKMEEDLSVAMSSRSGAGAWITNFAANSAYTIGIMGEIALEEAALWASTALTGGGTAPLAIARTVTNGVRLGKSMKILARLLSRPDKAKSFWTAVRGVGSAMGKGTLKFLNPFEHTTDLYKMAKNSDHAFHRLSDFAKTKKTYGAFYKDLRAINAATSEARLEGGFAQNKVANEALKEFYKKEGRSPNADEAFEISTKAFNAGQAVTMINAPVILATNNLVFGTYLKGFSPIRRIASKEGLRSSLFKLIENPNWKKAGLNPVEVVSRGFMSSAKRTFSKQYLQSIPSRLSGTFSRKGLSSGFGSGLRYFSANLAEGLQESFQEATQVAAEDYFLNQYYAELYKDPFLAAKNTLGSAIDKGISSQFTAQGLDVFAQGFLMGGALSTVGNILMPGAQRVTTYARSIFDKGATPYSEYVKTEQERLQKVADATNDYIKNSGKYALMLDENAKAQKDLADRYMEAENVGDREEAESVKDESLFTHVSTLLSTGRFDSFILHLEDMLQLSDEELNEAFPTTNNDLNTKSNREKLQSAIDKAKNIQQRAETLNQKVENPYNPDFFDKKKDPDAYERELIGFQAFEKAKQIALFHDYTFDRTVKRISSLVNNAFSNSPLGDVASLDVMAIYNALTGDQFTDYIKTVESEIEVMQNGTAEEKTTAKKKTTQIENLLKLKSLMFEYKRLLSTIEKAKQAFNDPQNASEESKKALESLKQKAKELAPEMRIYDDPVVDEVTGQLSMNFANEDIVNPDVIVSEHAKDLLYEAYAKYLKNLANLKNVFPIQSSIENSFGDLIDFLHLNHKAGFLAESANVLADPMSVYQMGARIAKSIEKANSQRKELHLQALRDYKENIIDVDDLLQKLADMNVYFDPKAIAEFRKTGKLPNYFIDATTGNIIDNKSDTYAKIVELIKNEEIRRGVTFNNKPVVPVTPPPATGNTTPTSVQNPPSDKDDLEEDAVVEMNVLTPFGKLPAPMQALLKQLHSEAVRTMGANNDIQEWMKDSPEAAAVIQGNYQPPAAPQQKTKYVIAEDKNLGFTLVTEDRSDYFKDKDGNVFWTKDRSEIEQKLKEANGEVTPAGKSTSTTDEEITAANPRSVDSATPGTKAIYDQAEQNNWKLTDDSKQYQNEEGTEKAGRVSDLKETDIDSEAPHIIAAQNRGNFLDQLLRSFAKPAKDGISFKDTVINATTQNTQPSQIKTVIEQWIRQQVKLDNLDTKNNIKLDQGVYKDFAEVLYQLATRYRGFIWHTSLPTMVGEIMGKKYGGTIDLLLEKNGKYYIIDLKTSGKIRKGNEMYDKGDSIQQNAYAHLFEQITGNPISGLYILNLRSKIESDNKTITNVSLIESTTTDNKKTILTPIPRKPIEDILGDKSGQPPAAPAPAAPAAEGQISPYAIMAANYLFTGGIGVMLSTDYFIQALSGAFINAGPKIEQIRQKYINQGIDLGFLKNAIGTENYNKIIAEIRDVIDSTYNNQEISDIFNVILNNPTGFPTRLGSEIELKLETLNEKLAVSEAKPTPATPAPTATSSDIEAEKQKITPAEFKEVVRLAKFFLENPSEPGVMGDARSRYPELFKAVTNIERRRQEELLKPISLSKLPDYLAETIQKAVERLSINERYNIIKAAIDNKTAQQIVSELNLIDKNGRRDTEIVRQVRAYYGVPSLDAEDYTEWKNKVDKINAEYDAELAALEGAKSMASPEVVAKQELEAKKADIPNQVENMFGKKVSPDMEFSKQEGDYEISQRTAEDSKTDTVTTVYQVVSNTRNGLGIQKVMDKNGTVRYSRTTRGYNLEGYIDQLVKDIESNPDILESLKKYGKEIKLYIVDDKLNYTKVKDFGSVLVSALNNKDYISDEQYMRLVMGSSSFGSLFGYNAELAALEGTQTSGGTPAKTKAPSRFAGKLIWAQVGTIDPKIFEDYDVIYANDVVEEVAKRRGITPENGKNIHQTIQGMPNANDVFNDVKSEIEKLKKEGKTIISDNWYLKEVADVVSSPPKSKAVYMKDATSPKESIESFEKYINSNQLRKQEYEQTQERSWKSKTGTGKTSVEKNTNLTVKELFKITEKSSTLVEDIVESSEGLDYLKNIMSAYAANPEIRKDYTIIGEDGSVSKVLSPEEVAQLIKDKGAQFIKTGRDYDTFTKEIDKILNKMMGPKTQDISTEDKKSAQDAINNAAIASDSAAATASDIAKQASEKTQQQVDDEFDDSLGCE